jgi:hypothetical protein
VKATLSHHNLQLGPVARCDWGKRRAQKCQEFAANPASNRSNVIFHGSGARVRKQLTYTQGVLLTEQLALHPPAAISNPMQ